MPEYVADFPDWGSPGTSLPGRRFESVALSLGSSSVVAPWGVETSDEGCGCAGDCASEPASVTACFGEGCACGGGSPFAGVTGVPQAWLKATLGSRSCQCSGPPGSANLGSAAPKGGYPSAPDDRTEPSAERLVELAQVPACSDEKAISIGLPPFSKLFRRTRRCFEQAGYSDSRWPGDDCCTVPRRQTTSCDLPSSVLVEWAKLQVPNYDNYYAWDPRLRKNKKGEGGGYLGRSYPHDPSDEDLNLFYSAVAFLWENWDVAIWATCLVSGWAPETLSRQIPSRLQLLKGLSYGTYQGGMHVTFVDRARDDRGNLGGATAWAFTYLTGGSAEDGSVGLIIPARHPDWEKRLREMACGGADALCTVAQLSGTLLHEMIHIVGPEFTNRPGTGVATHHLNECAVDDVLGFAAGVGGFDRSIRGPASEEVCERWPCWDECRMITSIYRYALSQRYACLEGAKMCGNMNDPQYVAISIKHDHAGQMLRNQAFRDGDCSGSS
jgi:hypothetical protein